MSNGTCQRVPRFRRWYDAEMVTSRRRRILQRVTAVALSVVALMALVDFLLRRAVDARFIGTWRLTAPDGRNLVWKLNRYGRGAAYLEQGSDRSLMVRSSWQVHGESLELKNENDQSDLAGWAKQEWRLLRHRLNMLAVGETVNEEHFRIVEVGPDRIVLNSLDDHWEFSLNRIPD